MRLSGDRAKPGAVSDQIAGQTLATQLDDLVGETVGQTARAAMRPRTAVQQSIESSDAGPDNPLGGRLGADAEGGCSRLPRGPLIDYKLGLARLLSTAEAESGILMNVHSISSKET